jgi:hypothetical protein
MGSKPNPTKKQLTDAISAKIDQSLLQSELWIGLLHGQKS